MKRLLAIAGVAALAFTGTQAHAVGTAADTLISNTARANYNVNGNPATEVTDTFDFRVDELIDVNVDRVGGVTTVDTPDSDRLISFEVTNTGNGTETFDIIIDAQLGGDQFDPTLNKATDIYLDDGDGIFEPGTDDVVFDPTTTDLTLAADETRRIWVRGDIPAALVDNDQADVNLQADTTTPGLAGAAAGTTAAGGGTGTGIDAVVGTSQGTDNDTQSYVVSAVVVAIDKDVASIVDPFGGSELVPGAIVTYSITVDVSGTGTAQSLVITDAIAAAATSNVAYVQESIDLDTFGQTDTADSPTDETQVNFAVPAEDGSAGDLAPGGVTIQVTLGDVSPAGGTVTNVITFDVEIQ